MKIENISISLLKQIHFLFHKQSLPLSEMQYPEGEGEGGVD